jgi:hypothetical protein
MQEQQQQDRWGQMDQFFSTRKIMTAISILGFLSSVPALAQTPAPTAPSKTPAPAEAAPQAAAPATPQASAPAAQAVAPAADQDDGFVSIDLQWFRPEFMPTQSDGTKKPGVILSGQTEPGIHVSLFVIKRVLPSGKLQVVYDSKAAQKPDITSAASVDPNGVFKLNINLPDGKYKLGFRFEDPKSNIRTKIVGLYLEYEGNKVDLIFDEKSIYEPNHRKNKRNAFSVLERRTNYFNFGVGADYLVYSKQNDAIPLNASFGSFNFPSLRLEYNRVFNSRWSGNADLFYGPGKASSGNQVQVQSGNFSWMIANLQASYTRPNWKTSFSGNGQILYGTEFGLHYDSIPFMKSVSTADTTQTMESSSIVNVSLGGYATFLTSKQWEYDVNLHYLYPVSASGFQLKSAITFNGSLGALFKPEKSKWAYGLYWYGEMINAKVSENDAYTQTSVDSKTGLLYSNLEFRTFYRF